MKTRAIVYILLAALCLPLTGQTSPATSEPDESLKAILPRLASEDFQQRAAAQKELEKLDYHALATLRKAAAEASDPEIKSRLTERLQQLNQQYALDPPPISL